MNDRINHSVIDFDCGGEKMPAYQDPKLKTWYVKFRYRDWQGRGKYTTKRGFKTKRDALNYEREIRFGYRDGLDVTIPAVVNNFLANKKIRVKISTYQKCESVLRIYFLPFFEHLKISQLTPKVMRDWQNDLIIKNNLKYSTLGSIHTIVNSFLNYAVKFYGLKSNPLKIVGNLSSISTIKKEPKKINIWTYEEFDKFIECVKNPKFRICFMILFFSGMRVGELLALSKKDFNFKENTINISKSKIKITGEISSPKTVDSIRVIDMPPLIMQEVKQYLKKLTVVHNPIFDTNHSSLWQALKKYSKIAGLKQIKIHDLRHSHASHLMYLGLPVTTISRRLGHKSPKITLDIYSHMYADSGKETAEMLNNIIKKSDQN